jgi:DNA helicase-2/ATP-dependent DNA helicase PcrA
MVPPILTEEQLAAVTWGTGPLMVLAGAGTGKTTVIVERVRHLLELGAGDEGPLEPENVLVLTYNVRAAGELVERLERHLGSQVASRLTVANFHSFGHRVLHDHRAEAGLADRIEVLDSVGQRLLLLELRPGLDLLYYGAGDVAGTLNHLADLIARARDELVSPAEYRAFAEERRLGFEFEFGTGAYEAALVSLRSRGDLRAVREVRSRYLNGRAAGERAADLESRRAVSGTGSAPARIQLSREQCAELDRLAPTFLRDAAALEVRRLDEEAQVFGAYVEALRARGAADFGEQILRTIELLRERPNILRRYQLQFRHVLVDEFQDANIAQIRLLELIGRAPDRPDNVLVVGDDDQSIYRFRGASYAAFEQFRERFSRPPEWAAGRAVLPVPELHLSLNRRSCENILSAATRLIEHNPKRLKAGTRLRALHPPGAPVEILRARDDTDEAAAVVARIGAALPSLPERIVRPDGSESARRWADIAVLYRKHRHREAIVERLRQASIPFTVAGGSGLFAQPEVRDAEAALRVMTDPDDSASFTRLLTAGPWRLDAREVLRVTRAASFDRLPVYEAASLIRRSGEIMVDVLEPPTVGAEVGAPPVFPPADMGAAGEDDSDLMFREPGLARAHATRRERLDAALRTKLARLCDCLGDLEARAHRDGPFTILDDYLARTGILHDLIATGTPEAQRSVLALARFMRFVADWQRDRPRGSLADFVTYLDVFQQVGGDLDTEPAGAVEEDGIQLMTVYQAKGLEFEVVVVPQLLEREFPDHRAERALIPVELLRQAPPDDFAEAEERRLCYVAMTRARSRLVLATIDGDGGRRQPSRFVDEVAPAGSPEARVDRWSDSLDPPPGMTDRLADVLVVRRGGQRSDEPATVPVGGARAGDEDARAVERLLRLVPYPPAFDPRFRLRRRAVELIGGIEQLRPDDDEGRDRLIGELIEVAASAGREAEDARSGGASPLTFQALARHQPAGKELLRLVPLPDWFSHTGFVSYQECPLRFAFERIYRIPVADAAAKPYFGFGSIIHAAYEAFGRAELEARAAGVAGPTAADLERFLDDAWQPASFSDAAVAETYRSRGRAALRNFHARQLSRLGQAILLECRFELAIDPGEGEPPVHLTGAIDRIDRHPDGSLELVDYKTGRPKSQGEVDRDVQLTTYALAVRDGGVRDPDTGRALPTPERLTLYFTESDQWITTSRTDDQLDSHRDELVSLARRVRSGDFAATPDYRRCSSCDYRRVCPSRWGDPPCAS